ncbi:transposase-like protein [Paraburkholderia silvatlantica]|uniref:Transposase-like protein n=1 Tax=Paraburkholderia silvatlantica TaxID=321895 RepID=A0ABR6FIH8_9BURK|nr:transposase-like protein [Paraburkholderia silvatlantica]
MNKTKSLYHGHRFPAVVISCAVRWYFRFSLSLRDIEELLLERGVVVTYERSVAGVTNSVLDSPGAPGRCGASLAARGTLTRCS